VKIKPSKKPPTSVDILRKRKVKAVGAALENKKRRKKINAGIIASKAGTIHAPNFNALSFAKSLRVTSYLGSISFIFTALLYKLYKLYSNLPHQKIKPRPDKMYYDKSKF
jgi:hypothetical protein